MKHLEKIPFRSIKISFASKLFIVYLSLMMLPLLLLMMINYYRSVQITAEQAKYSNEKVISQTTAFLEYKLASLNNIVNIISFDEEVHTLLDTSNEYYRENIGHWTVQTTYMKNIIYNSYTTNDISSVQLYMKNGSASFESTNTFRTLSQAKQNQWYERLGEASSRGTAWIPSVFFDGQQSSRYVSIVKRITDSNNVNRNIGIIKADIPEKVFQDIIAQTATTVHTFTVLYNSYGEIITFTGDQNLMNIDMLTDVIHQNNIPPDGVMQSIDYQDQTYLMGVHGIEGTDWNLAMLVPNDDILISASLNRRQLFAIVAILFFGFVPLVYLTSNSITVRIRRLQKHMKASTATGFNIEPLENGRDEIGELTRSFDIMAGKINGLLQEQYRLGYEIQNLELRVLQSLINPHFLYNTLDMIYWMSMKNHVPEISGAVKSLSKFYKLSLGHGEDIVTLSKELDHVKAYVDIQNMRFENKITLKLEIPPELYGCQVIKIILQPLVENAILHGIRERKKGYGTICIRAAAADDMLKITLEDDGVGMSQEQLSQLLQKPGKNKGYGVWNINERIRLTYGNDYGLCFSSTLNEGTTVTLSLPYIPTL